MYTATPGGLAKGRRAISTHSARRHCPTCEVQAWTSTILQFIHMDALKREKIVGLLEQRT
jgi:hypothetical protein